MLFHGQLFDTCRSKEFADDERTTAAPTHCVSAELG
jgi:hypothetical protein